MTCAAFLARTALAATTTGDEHDDARGSADEHAEQAPNLAHRRTAAGICSMLVRPSTSTSVSHCDTPAFYRHSGSRARDDLSPN